MWLAKQYTYRMQTTVYQPYLRYTSIIYTETEFSTFSENVYTKQANNNNNNNYVNTNNHIHIHLGTERRQKCQ